MHYNDLTQRHFAATAAAGELTGATVRRGAAGDRSRGTWVQFDVRIAMPGGQPLIQEARFLAFACPHVIAVADWIALAATGRPATSVLPETVHALSGRFDVPIEKLGRLLIVEDAWIAAVSPPYGP